MEKALLNPEEIALAQHCLTYAQQQGASGVRITLSKSLTNLIGLLNGEVDKIIHTLDRSLQLQLFVDGRYGAFSSNRLDKDGLEHFICEAIGTVRMLEEDGFRRLPAAERLEKQATTGRELSLYDPACETLTAPRRRAMAAASIAWDRLRGEKTPWQLISEEGEYSDSVFDSLTLDSQGLYARHTETSFEIGYESTVEDAEGNHFSSYWWDASPRLSQLQWKDCAARACRRAVAQIGPQAVPSGKYPLIVDSECAAKLVSPLLSALGGFALQQKNSFLTDSLGQQRFPESLTILDRPRKAGDSGCRLYDSEGVATRDRAIIEKGVVKTYFLNTYIAAKLGTAPTIEDATRVVVQPVGGCKTQEELLQQIGNGILVTAFNGGNSNPATGNFSYGIEGFLIQDGKRKHPVREMLITGNFLELWKHLLATADDARPCLSKLIPSLAFSQVDVSA